MRIISGKFRNRKLVAPKGEHVRPSSDYLREMLFNLLRHDVEGSRFLDLFAGSGTVGIEALSRGAKEVIFVEENKAALKCLKQNLAPINEEINAIVIPTDVFKTLDRFVKNHECFDIIFSDPPYARSNAPNPPLSDLVLQFVDENDLLNPKGSLFLEDSLNKPPANLELKNLTLVDQRRAGKTLLQHFQKKE